MKKRQIVSLILGLCLVVLGLWMINRPGGGSGSLTVADCGAVTVQVASTDVEVAVGSVDQVTVRAVAGAERAVEMKKVGRALKVTAKKTLFSSGGGMLYISLPEDYAGPIHVETASGDVIAGLYNGGDLTVITASGSTVVLKAEVGSLNLSAVSGKVSVEDVKAADVTVNTVSGDVSLDGVDSPSVRVDTVSGDAEVHMSVPESDCAYALETVSGDVEVNGKKTGSVSRSGGERLVEVGTVSGDIELEFR